MKRPLYPADGVMYMQALVEAQEEYDEWLRSRKGISGITIYSRKELDAAADREDFDLGA
jgi:heme/copper-type cytochrome/quinol oxidase subunit 2